MAEASKIWSAAIASAPPTFFLHVDPATTRIRRPTLDAASRLDTDEKLASDIAARLDIVDRYGRTVIGKFDTGLVPQRQIVDAVVSHVLASRQDPARRYG